MKKQLWIIVLTIMLPFQAVASTAEQRGLKIALEVDRRNSGFEDCRVDAIMTLKSKDGGASRRIMRSRALETENDGDKTLTIFDAPPDVRGTALLTHAHKSGDDDQWLFLPALKRVKRISANNRSASFMGSEFSYEDLASREVEKYDYRYLRDDSLDNKECFVIEISPRDMTNSGYSRIISWIDMEKYIVHREEYYDKKKRLLKILTLGEYNLYLGSLWRPHKLEMVNSINGRTTELVRENYQFKTGLSHNDFSKGSLKRSR